MRLRNKHDIRVYEPSEMRRQLKRSTNLIPTWHRQGNHLVNYLIIPISMLRCTALI